MANKPPVQVCSLAPKGVNVCARPAVLLVSFNSTDAHDQINTQYGLTLAYISLSSGSAVARHWHGIDNQLTLCNGVRNSSNNVKIFTTLINDILYKYC